MNFLCHLSLIRSLLSQLRSSDSVHKTPYPIFPFKIALLARKSNISRVAYSELIKALGKQTMNNQFQTTIERKWCRDIGRMHEGTMQDIRLSTKNTYMQSFHFRIVSRIIATNTFLYRIGRADSPPCFFCKESDETLLHILW